jgi:hypothetical protein
MRRQIRRSASSEQLRQPYRRRHAEHRDRYSEEEIGASAEALDAIVWGLNVAFPCSLTGRIRTVSAHTNEFDSSHVPMLSQPDRVLDVIRTAANAV